MCILGGEELERDASPTLKWQVLEGRFDACRVLAALTEPVKRETLRMGITSGDELVGNCCLVKVVRCTEADGSQHNLVTKFQFLGTELASLNDFMPYAA